MPVRDVTIVQYGNTDGTRGAYSVDARWMLAELLSSYLIMVNN